MSSEGWCMQRYNVSKNKYIVNIISRYGEVGIQVHKVSGIR